MHVAEIATMAQADPSLEAKLKADPIGTMNTLSGMPLATDRWIYRGVIVALGFVAIAGMVGGITLAFYGKTTPEGVVALGSTAVGAMAGLLAPSPKST